MPSPISHKTVLNLKPGKKQSFNVIALLHIIFVTIPLVLIRIPLAVFFEHILPFVTFYMYKSHTYRELGRRAIPDIVVRFARDYLTRGSPAEGRASFFGRKTAYSMMYARPSWRQHKAWRANIAEPSYGVTGRWIADNPHVPAQRKDDDLVILFVHGGGFVVDTGGTCQLFWLHLMKECFLTRGIKLSIFQLDYELAPDFQFPNQIIEICAAYSWLVNGLGISPSKIVLSGDSAAGQLIAATLLHLARPSPDIRLPDACGPLPQKPRGSLLISPFIKFLGDSNAYARNASFDLIEIRCASLFAMQYLGCTPVPSTWWGLSFNPAHLFGSPHPDPASFLVDHLPLSEKQRKKELPTVKEMLANPYANVGGMKDRAWWGEAMPSRDGANMVVWGGKEIFTDDISEFVRLLEDSEVPVVRLKKDYAVHDWLLYEPTIPWLRLNKGKGPDQAADWGVNHVADWIQGIVREEV